MNTVDLHVHSNKSDGSFTPSELVDMAIAKGLTAFALTDHDTTAGVKEAVAYGQEKGIEVIPGIEFSTEYYGKDVHIVGLFIDENAPAFQEQIGSFVRAREERNEKCAPASLQTASISAMKSCWKPFRTASLQEGITPDICSTTAMSKACRKRSTAISGTIPNILFPGKNHARPGGFPNSRRQGHPGSRPSDALPYGKG